MINCVLSSLHAIRKFIINLKTFSAENYDISDCESMKPVCHCHAVLINYFDIDIFIVVAQFSKFLIICIFFHFSMHIAYLLVAYHLLFLCVCKLCMHVVMCFMCRF